MQKPHVAERVFIPYLKTCRFYVEQTKTDLKKKKCCGVSKLIQSHVLTAPPSGLEDLLTFGPGRTCDLL